MQMKRLGAKALKNPSPRPPIGAPRTRLLTRSIAAPVIHISWAVEAMITLHSAGRASLTTVSYTPGDEDPARVSRMSVKIEMKIGSADRR